MRDTLSISGELHSDRSDHVVVNTEEVGVGKNNEHKLQDILNREQSINPFHRESTFGILDMVQLCGKEGDNEMSVGQINVTTGRLMIKNNSIPDNIYFAQGGEVAPKGVKSYIMYSGTGGIVSIYYMLVDWDIVNQIEFGTNTEPFIISESQSPKSVEGKSFKDMLLNLSFDITSVTHYNSDEIPYKGTIKWYDGKSGTFEKKQYSPELLEYQECVYTYPYGGSASIKIQESMQFDENGYIIKKSIKIIG